MQEIILDNIKLAEYDNNMCLYVYPRNLLNLECCNKINDISNKLQTFIKNYKSKGYAIIYVNYC